MHIYSSKQLKLSEVKVIVWWPTSAPAVRFCLDLAAFLEEGARVFPTSRHSDGLETRVHSVSLHFFWSCRLTIFDTKAPFFMPAPAPQRHVVAVVSIAHHSAGVLVLRSDENGHVVTREERGGHIREVAGTGLSITHLLAVAVSEAC